MTINEIALNYVEPEGGLTALEKVKDIKIKTRIQFVCIWYYTLLTYYNKKLDYFLFLLEEPYVKDVETDFLRVYYT